MKLSMGEIWDDRGGDRKGELEIFGIGGNVEVKSRGVLGKREERG